MSNSIIGMLDQYTDLRKLKLDTSALLKSLGVDLENSSYIDLSAVPVTELDDLMMKSLMWMERVNEILSTSKKLEMDMDLEKERIYAAAVRATPDEMKISEARTVAKSNHKYVVAVGRYNTLKAYTDYLERLLNTLDKYHYAIKNKLDRHKSLERKY